jgi:hypothetical protein
MTTTTTRTTTTTSSSSSSSSIKINDYWMRCIKCGYNWRLITTSFRSEIMCNECELEVMDKKKAAAEVVGEA